MARRIKHPIATGFVIVLVVVLAAGALVVYRWATTRWAITVVPPTVRCQATIGTETAGTDTASITPEQAQNAAIIAGVATQRGLAPRAVSIALTTAFQESNLINVDYGDRDSLGLFQQRPSMGWGTPDQIMNPYYSSGKFYDALVKVSDWQTGDIGDVAQEVQRSGFPDAYDKHVDQAKLLASALSGQTPASWSCIVRGAAAPDPNQLLTALTQAYGATITASLTPAAPASVAPSASASSTPASLAITASDQAVAWSVAAFAQSWAVQTGVSAVSVGDSTWTASANVLSGWVATSAATSDGTSVTVTF